MAKFSLVLCAISSKIWRSKVCASRAFFRFSRYDISDGCWPPLLAPNLSSIFIKTMVGRFLVKTKGEWRWTFERGRELNVSDQSSRELNVSDRVLFESCEETEGYCSFAYSDLAASRMGISARPSFHSARKSW